LELNVKLYFSVQKCESCKCTAEAGAGEFCGDQTTKYLEETCIPDHLYHCPATFAPAEDVNHCLQGCKHGDKPGLDHCVGGF
jgi:hypothetical protein